MLSYAKTQITLISWTLNYPLEETPFGELISVAPPLTLTGAELLSTLLEFEEVDLRIPISAISSAFTHSNPSNNSNLPPETEVIMVKPNAFGTVIRVTGYDDMTPSDSLWYSWRINSGFWKPWSPSNEIIVGPLLEGTHTVEVRAIDEAGIVDITPAKVTFRIDSVPPDIYTDEREVFRTENPVIKVKFWDFGTRRIKVSWKLESGGIRTDWTDWEESPSHIKLEGLTEGWHTLVIRAKDEVGNTREYRKHLLVKLRKSFGC
jgi:hypothetical protein